LTGDTTVTFVDTEACIVNITTKHNYIPIDVDNMVLIIIIIIIIIEADEILKYKYLTIGIQSMWNVKTNVIPVIIIGATGTISKLFRKYVSYIPGKHEVKELQKTAILGTAHILRKVLM